MRVDGGVGLSDTVTLQHVEEGCLSSVVQTQEYDVCILLEESEPAEGCLEKVHNERHYSKYFV